MGGQDGGIYSQLGRLVLSSRFSFMQAERDTKPMDRTEGFAQLQLRFIDPIQYDYEIIRPVVLFAETVAERSRETEMERTTVGEKARRFVTRGMLGLVDQRQNASGRKGHEYPENVAEYILYLKQLYPPIHYREIVRIVGNKFNYQTNHHTVKHFLEQNPVLVQLELAIERYHEFEDAYQARWTVVRMYYEGWNKESIAGVLKLSVRHVARLIEAFEQDGFAGLEDKRSRPTEHPDNQLTLPFMDEVLKIQQEYPRLGRFRVHGLLEQELGEEDTPSERTVGRAMAFNRFFQGAPGPWPPSDSAEEESKDMPFQPFFRHQYWFIDIRYLVQLDGHWVYSLCIIEGYSRKILAGTASPYQDELAVLQILHAALSEYGCPAEMVSDNGSVFTAHAYEGILFALDIQVQHIEKGAPWQNLIEAQFKVQLRLADARFEQATTLEEVQAHHAAFMETFNTTNHWAHRDRQDGCRTPAAVLGQKYGRFVNPDTLRSAFRHLQLSRTVNQHGYISVQRYVIYAEHGLAKRRVSVWIYEDRLNIAYQQSLLARFNCTLDRQKKALKSVSQPTLYQTAFASPQMELFQLDEEQWLKVWQRLPYGRRKKADSMARQLPLLPVELALLLLLLGG